MYSVYLLLDAVLALLMWTVIGWVILHLLIQLNVVNTQNRFVTLIGSTLYRVVTPMLRPIQRQVYRLLPDLKEVDISPIILLLILYFIRNLLTEYWPHGL